MLRGISDFLKFYLAEIYQWHYEIKSYHLVKVTCHKLDSSDHHEKLNLIKTLAISFVKHSISSKRVSFEHAGIY